MPDDVPKLITVGVIAKAVGTTPERIRRILESRPHIQPVARAGLVRLFTPEAIEEVRYELAGIASRRRRRNRNGR